MEGEGFGGVECISGDGGCERRCFEGESAVGVSVKGLGVQERSVRKNAVT